MDSNYLYSESTEARGTKRFKEQIFYHGMAAMSNATPLNCRFHFPWHCNLHWESKKWWDRWTNIGHAVTMSGRVEGAAQKKVEHPRVGKPKPITVMSSTWRNGGFKDPRSL